MPDDADEYLDEEGIPTTDEQPPGIDLELEEEGLVPPRDHSVAAGSDPAYPVTAAEERSGEAVSARARRENPDFGRGTLGTADEAEEAGALYEPDSDVDEVDETAEEVGLVGDRDGAMSAEEAAVHLASEDVADDVDPDVEMREYTEDR